MIASRSTTAPQKMGQNVSQLLAVTGVCHRAYQIAGSRTAAASPTRPTNCSTLAAARHRFFSMDNLITCAARFARGDS
jgi:hypothetical protein